MASKQDNPFYERVKSIIGDKIANDEEWKYWNRKDFTEGSDTAPFPQGSPIVVLSRMANKKRLMELTNNKELTKEKYEELIKCEILKRKEKVDGGIQEEFRINNNKLPMPLLDKWIGGDGVTFADCLIISGLSKSSCDDFSHGNKLRSSVISWKNKKREIFDPNQLLRSLLGIEDLNLRNLEPTRRTQAISVNANSSDFLDRLCQLNYNQEDFIFSQFLETETRVGAFWLNGEEKAGQEWLLHRFSQKQCNSLLTNAVKKKFNIAKKWSIETVWEKVGEWLRVSGEPQAIVEELYKHWSNQVSVVLVLSGVNKLRPNDLQQLWQNLWQPLAQRACQQQSRYPLILFLIDTDSNDDHANCLTVTDTYVNPEIVVRLRLEKFKNGSLKLWSDNHCGVISQGFRTCSSLDHFTQTI